MLFERYENTFKMTLTAKGKFPFRKRALLSWDWKTLRQLHPKMKAENLLEQVLQPALTGDKKEAKCLNFQGDTWLLIKALGIGPASSVFEAKEEKEKEQEEARKQKAETAPEEPAAAPA